MRKINLRAYSFGHKKMLKIVILNLDATGEVVSVVLESGETLKKGEFSLVEGTGFLDVESDEIFNGDVLELTTNNPMLNAKYVVRRATSGAWRIDNPIQGRELSFFSNSCRILGNVFENEEFQELADFLVSRG